MEITTYPLFKLLGSVVYALDFPAARTPRGYSIAIRICRVQLEMKQVRDGNVRWDLSAETERA